MTRPEINFEVHTEPSSVPIKAWTKGVPIEPEAFEQVKNVARLPFIHKHVALMPDVHVGAGSTIGSVIPTYKAIIPAAVGVDIGCGMMALKTALTANDMPDNLSAIRSAIEAVIPHGRSDNGGCNDKGAWWGDVPSDVLSQSNAKNLMMALKPIVDKHPKLERAYKRAPNHIGTLGTGNHFIELCLDENDYVWIMLHSGSRGIGNRIGSHFIELAKNEMRRWHINLPDTNLAYLPEGSDYFSDYIRGVSWAQDYAKANRVVMMRQVLDVLIGKFDGTIVQPDCLETATNCHHNYVEMENHFGKNIYITRKGAVRARKDELGIIPGSMGAKSFIVRGKGEKQSFCSCSHGAGRVMSRTQARKTFTLEDHIKDTAGIECRKDADVIDETPKAYKDIEAVMAAQSDLVEVVHTLRQIVCVKG